MAISRTASFTHLFALIMVMQQRLRESYLEMAFNDSASCAPVGMAWKKSKALDSTLNLYTS